MIQRRNASLVALLTPNLSKNRGELHLLHRAVAAAFSLAKETVYLCTGAGGITGTLPAAAANYGKVYCVLKIDAAAGVVTVARAGADLINGAVSVPVTNQWDYVWLWCDGVSNWYVVG